MNKSNLFHELKAILQAHVNSWDDLYEKLLLIKDDEKLSKAGFIFELFSYYYFKQSNQYKKVYLHSHIPQSLKNKLKLPKKEKGIDLLLEDHHGRLIGVQCKFRKNQSDKLGWKKDSLSHLIAHRYINHFIVFSNASDFDKDVKKQASVDGYLFSHLASMEKDVFSNIRLLLKNKKPKKKRALRPKAHQVEAIQKIVSGFKKEDRGKLILPCGSGKTLTSLWVYEKMKPKKTLVLLPSLSLLKQFKDTWISESKKALNYFIVCSSKDTDVHLDHLKMKTHELGFKGMGVSTDKNQIKKWIKESKSDLVIFSTYQSLDQIKKALKGIKFKFDLCIFDEAHKTASSKKSNFTLGHLDKNIPIKKRLYMTATPRILSAQLIKNEARKYSHDMNDEKTYGSEFYRMSFSEAIKRKILCDYQIHTVGVYDKEIKEKIKNQEFIKYKSESKSPETMRDLADHVSLKKLFKKLNLKHVLSFHSRIESAKDFSEQYGLNNKEVKSFHISGSQNVNHRKRIMKEFENSKKALLSNARCLTEGVDIPAIDGVLFCDPKKSKIDIVQAAGRALRIKTGKKRGYILIPLYHTKDEDIEEVIKNDSFKNLISVIRALSDHDERIEQEIFSIRYGKGKRKKGRIVEGSTQVLDGIKENFPKKHFDVFTQEIAKSLRIWMPFKDAREFVRSKKLKNHEQWSQYCKSGKKPYDIPVTPYVVYKNKGWINLGDFLGTGNVATQDMKYRTFKEARKFARSLKLKGEGGWREYSKSGKKPEDIPSNPNRTYKNKGWTNWGDFLGTGNVYCKDSRTFKEARKFARSLKLKNWKEWRDYCKSNKKPYDIPVKPDRKYKNKGWTNWGDFLGTGNVHRKDFRSFKEARKFARKMKFKGTKDWFIYCKSNKKPKDIPVNCAQIYKEKWISWGDFLGTGYVAHKNKKFKSFKEARKFARILRLNSATEWHQYCKSGKRPYDIPSNPDKAYKNKGWTSWGDFLGNGNLPTHKRKNKTFKKARNFTGNLKITNNNEWSK